MIASVSIKNLRGIRDGTVEGLTPLVVLVGPNSSGKSTILDALLIGASPTVSMGIGRAVRRRLGVLHGARWLFWKGGAVQPATVEIAFADATVEKRTCTLRWSETCSEELVRKLEGRREAPGPYSGITADIEEIPSRGAWSAATAFAANNLYAGSDSHRPQPTAQAPSVWIVDPRYGPPLHDLYSGIGERGRRQALLDLVAGVVPGLSLIEVHTDQGDPRLNLTFADGSVPVALAGDGIQALVRMCLELSARPESAGTVLLEEPEARQHPAAIRASAQAIVEAVRRDLQVSAPPVRCGWRGGAVVGSTGQPVPEVRGSRP